MPYEVITSNLELLLQGAGDSRCSGRDRYRIERSVPRAAEGAVGTHDLDVLPAPEQVELAEALALVAGEIQDVRIRITSYNVCYTKLLRDLDLEEGLNSVVITTSATQGGILFDMLGCYSAGISEGICNTSISPSEANTGIIAYPNPFTDAIVVQSEHPFEFV